MRISVLNTTTFRLMLFACLAFVSVGGATVGFLYWSVLFRIDRQVGGALQRESADMMIAYESGGYGRLRQTVADRASPHEDALRVYLLQGSDGTLTGNLAQWPADVPKPGMAADIQLPGIPAPARVRTLDFVDGARLLVGRVLIERNNFQSIAGESLIGALAANLLLGVVAGTMLARYARRRLEQINTTTQEVLEGNLSVRIAVGEGGDEYDHLAQNINAMLGRIERLMATVRGVTENVAHDLRTPLNRLRSRLEVALLSPRSPEEYEGVLKRAIAESETIVDVFNAILKIARIKAGALDLHCTRVDLQEVVEELLDFYQAFAEENCVTLEAQPSQGQSVIVSGDGHLISQAAANLIDNAIKYSPPGGKVTVAALQNSGGASLTIADNGPGIPEEKRTAILDRFVRLGSTAGKPGFGLGLSFAAAVAEWHGARLELAGNEPGLRATLFFPAARVAAAS